MAAVCAALTIAALLPTAATAAPQRNGWCEEGEFCLDYSYNADQFPSESAVLDVTGSIPRCGTTRPTCREFRNYWGDATFPGLHQCVKQNARSAWNRTSRTVRLYLQENWVGDERRDIRPGQEISNLRPPDGENQSQSVASDGRC